MSVTLELSSDRRDTLYRENYKTSKPLPAEVYLQQDNSKCFNLVPFWSPECLHHVLVHVMAEILAAEADQIKSEDSKEESVPEEEARSAVFFVPSECEEHSEYFRSSIWAWLTMLRQC